ncbi:hypothetical protein [Streptosporangium saharense]|uniref:Uncharacterized protein n=1 Tax=Streptosporangium saharense TaxID=1706840 RepID=A0A7W7VQL3_9ACTN|nr:hypothetical protein [Streptosporangium saharense]MBB4919152.1 hypothetical protein [Streptosporangium saharense]
MRRRRPWLPASLLAAAVIVVMGGDGRPVMPPPGSVETTPVRLEGVLERAALVAGRRGPDITPKPDQWMYRKVVDRQPNDTRSTGRAMTAPARPLARTRARWG